MTSVSTVTLPPPAPASSVAVLLCAGLGVSVLCSRPLTAPPCLRLSVQFVSRLERSESSVAEPGHRCWYYWYSWVPCFKLGPGQR